MWRQLYKGVKGCRSGLLSSFCDAPRTLPLSDIVEGIRVLSHPTQPDEGQGVGKSMFYPSQARLEPLFVNPEGGLGETRTMNRFVEHAAHGTSSDSATYNMFNQRKNTRRKNRETVRK